ncbi:MAG: hypothetical protein ABJK28_02840 [Algibacter sp.]
MKLIINLFLLIFIKTVAIGQTQNKFNLSVDKNSNLQVKIDTISKETFNKLEVSRPIADYYTKNSDSLLKVTLIKYSNVLTYIDTCLVFIVKKGKLSLCKYIPEPYSKNQTDFKLAGIENDYLVFEQIGYEQVEYLSYNPNTKMYFYTSKYPHFISKNLVFSYGNYYGEGQFEIFDIEENKRFSFDSFNWLLVKLYIINNEFYIEFSSNFSIRENKYIKISLEI